MVDIPYCRSEIEYFSSYSNSSNSPGINPSIFRYQFVRRQMMQCRAGCTVCTMYNRTYYEESWPMSSISTWAPGTDMSLPRFKPPTSCTAGGDSSKELFEQLTQFLFGSSSINCHLTNIAELRDSVVFLPNTGNTAQQTQVHLRLSCGSVHGSYFSNIGLGGLLYVPILCMHRRAGPKTAKKEENIWDNNTKWKAHSESFC